ncbi:hypothetical protein CEXT_87821 [Caerostris extrusa]|uniref:Uncharacterized protein n=1 Tax=Caerostris extrusa TaxID=172846 RepID=A0AAV4QWU0_CAEEX|nr:hypothetical protein CEXT_87821 [Caerostris extrusa]
MWVIGGDGKDEKDESHRNSRIWQGLDKSYRNKYSQSEELENMMSQQVSACNVLMNDGQKCNVLIDQRSNVRDD